MKEGEVYWVGVTPVMILVPKAHEWASALHEREPEA